MRLGQDEFWWDTLEEANGYRVEPSGYCSYEDFVDKQRVIIGNPEYRKYKRYPFATPSGKVELYSTMLEQLGYNPLPNYEEPAESPFSTPELAREFPLILITGGKIRTYYHSEFRQIRTARQKHPDPLMQLHPDTAKEFGINEGDWVVIETPIGSVKQRALLDPMIHPRVIHAEHGWWLPEQAAPEHGVWESNINLLVNSEPPYDPGMGSTPVRSLLCRIYKVEEN